MRAAARGRGEEIWAFWANVMGRSPGCCGGLEERSEKGLEAEKGVVGKGFAIASEAWDVENGFALEDAVEDCLEPKMVSPSIGGSLGGDGWLGPGAST